MDKFYERLIKKTETQRTKDEEKEKPVNPLLVKNERVIPKLRVKFKKRRKRRFR